MTRNFDGCGSCLVRRGRTGCNSARAPSSHSRPSHGALRLEHTSPGPWFHGGPSRCVGGASSIPATSSTTTSSSLSTSPTMSSCVTIVGSCLLSSPAIHPGCRRRRSRSPGRHQSNPEAGIPCHCAVGCTRHRTLLRRAGTSPSARGKMRAHMLGIRNLPSLTLLFGHSTACKAIPVPKGGALMESHPHLHPCHSHRC